MGALESMAGACSKVFTYSEYTAALSSSSAFSLASFSFFSYDVTDLVK
jgi:hypothetical protein